MNQEKHSVYRIFQSSGVPEYTRIDVPSQKTIFDSFLNTPNEHLLIHGPSKTGKSTLWVSKVGEENVIKIPCNANMSLIDIYKEIVDELDIFFTNAQGVSESVKTNFAAEIKAKFVGLFQSGLSSSLTIEESSEKQKERIISPQISSRNIHKFVKETKKYIVLENIHYANHTMKLELAKELHNFSDYQCKWIIVGVQHQADQIFLENRDLVGRLKEIHTGLFNKDQVFEILGLGEKHLNIKFSNELKESIYNESFGTGALVQDIAKNICIHAGILETQDSPVMISDMTLLSKACKGIAESNKQVYIKFCGDISAGGRSDGTTKKYIWFLKLIKDIDIPVSGFLNTEVFQKIRSIGNQKIDQSGVTQGLSYLNTLQQKRHINPPVLEYDSEKKRLFLLDPYFRFALRWVDELIPDSI